MSVPSWSTLWIMFFFCGSVSQVCPPPPPSPHSLLNGRPLVLFSLHWPPQPPSSALSSSFPGATPANLAPLRFRNSSSRSVPVFFIYLFFFIPDCLERPWGRHRARAGELMWCLDMSLSSIIVNYFLDAAALSLSCVAHPCGWVLLAAPKTNDVTNLTTLSNAVQKWINCAAFTNSAWLNLLLSVRWNLAKKKKKKLGSTQRCHKIETVWCREIPLDLNCQIGVPPSDLDFGPVKRAHMMMITLKLDF